MSLLRRLSRLIGVAVWLVIAVAFWLDGFDPSWWFVGFAFSYVAVDLLIHAVLEELL